MSKVFFSLTLALVVIASTVSADGGKWKNKMENITCKGEAINMKLLWVGKKECAEEMMPKDTTTAATTTDKPDMKEMMKKWKELHQNVCYHVCSWKKQQILNDDGTYNSDGTEKMIKGVFPASVQEAFKTAVDECAKENGKTFSTDNNCEGYKAFWQCKVKKFTEICEVKATKDDHPHTPEDV